MSRAEQKAAMRIRLIDAARSLFGYGGYEGVTVREIALAAGVSTGAIFSRFGDKDGLFEAAMGCPVPVIWDVLEKILNADPLDAVGDYQADIKALHAAIYGEGAL